MKKTIALSLTLILVLGLSACGKDATKKDSNRGTDPADTTVLETKLTTDTQAVSTTTEAAIVTTVTENVTTTVETESNGITTSPTESAVTTTQKEIAVTTKAPTTVANKTTATTKAPITTKNPTTAKPTTTTQKTTTTKATTTTTKKLVVTHFENYNIEGRWNVNCVTAVPVEWGWNDSKLVVKVFIVNGYADRTLTNLSITGLKIHNESDIIAQGGFSNANQRFTLAPLTYQEHQFTFSGDSVLKPKADISDFSVTITAVEAN